MFINFKNRNEKKWKIHFNFDDSKKTTLKKQYYMHIPQKC